MGNLLPLDSSKKQQIEGTFLHCIYFFFYRGFFLNHAGGSIHLVFYVSLQLSGCHSNGQIWNALLVFIARDGDILSLAQLADDRNLNQSRDI